jgi:uncharacterized protein YpmB
MGKKTTVTVIITIVILIIAAWVFTSTYTSARDQYLKGHDKSKALAIEKGKLSSVDRIETFYGQRKYHVLSGTNAKHKKVYVWIPQTEKNESVIVKEQSAGITKEQAITNVNQEYDPVEIVSVKLGMDEGIPIWEVKYKSQSGRFTYDYVDFNNGEIIKHMALKSTEDS